MTIKGKQGKVILLVVVMITSSAVNAQFLDTIRGAYLDGHRLIGGLGSRNSILSGEPVRIYQLYAGLDYSSVFRVQAGFSFMPRSVSDQIIYDRYTSHADTVNSKSNIYYLSGAFEYSFYRQEKWKLTVPVQLGIGVNKIRQYDLRGNEYDFSNKLIVPMETGVNALYHINRWLGVKAGLGVRFVAGKNVLAELSGPYYYIGAAVFFGEIYKMVFKE